MTIATLPLRPAIGIVDACSAVAYDPAEPSARGIGGTEATVLRIASGLGDDLGVHLYQKTRQGVVWRRGMTLKPLSHAFRPGAAQRLIVINSWKVACRLRRAHPTTPISLWLHVHPGKHNRRMGAALAAAEIDVICVSHSHADALRAFLGHAPAPSISCIHNPIADSLRPDGTRRDPDSLLFASSPHKGLSEVFARFAELRAHRPSLRLRVADPGYLRWDAGPPPEGVVPLGRLDHAGVVREMRRALCLFYPQTSFAETFGLVMAEANAVGAPVLAHRGLGANDEVVSGPEQLVDAASPSAILARIDEWRREPPRIEAPERFRLSNVLNVWRGRFSELLEIAEPVRSRSAS